MTTASTAARLGSAERLPPLEMSEGFLDTLDTLEAEIRTMRKDMRAAKAAAGKQRAVREDLDLRAKVGCL